MRAANAAGDAVSIDFPGVGKIRERQRGDQTSWEKLPRTEQLPMNKEYLFMRRRKSTFPLLSLVCALGISLAGCGGTVGFGASSGGSSGKEVGKKNFTEELSEYGVSLETCETGLSEARRRLETDAGSESYDTLIAGAKETYTFDSSAETTYGYELASWQTIEQIRAVSTADQTPAIYLLSGNEAYDTGMCSNVCAINGKSATQVTIRDCVFENMSGISLYGCSDVVIENCYFKGAENGIHLAKCTGVTIRNCTFEMNDTGLTDYYQGVYLGDGNNYITVTDCYFKADGDIKKAFRVGSTSNEEAPSQNVMFEGCVAEGSFRTGFQNIDGEALLKDCIFIFPDNRAAYDSAVIVDAGSDKIHTALQNCQIYAAYRKPLSTSSTTVFENCSYGLFEK